MHDVPSRRAAVPKGAEPSAGAVAFALAVQRGRFAVYNVGFLFSLIGHASGIMQVSSWLQAILIVVLADLSVGAFMVLLRRGTAIGPPTAAAIAIDLLLNGWCVAISGGAQSPWFVWFLATVSAAAFVDGNRGTLITGAGAYVVYLGTLFLMGDLTSGQAALQAFVRMSFLFGASLFFLRGVALLREKQLQVRRLRADEALKLDELIRLTQDLDQGTRALAEANLQIREADRVKSQFLANMSHELRTPLNSIIGFSEILMERLAGQVQPKHEKFLHNIHSSGQHLLAIINDILDLSKVEAGKMELHPEEFGVSSAIEGVLTVMHGLAARRRVTFEVDLAQELPRIVTDPSKFKQVLYNIVSNAVRDGPSLVRAADSSASN